MRADDLRNRIDWCEHEARACERLGAERLARWWYDQALALTMTLFEVCA